MSANISDQRRGGELLSGTARTGGSTAGPDPAASDADRPARFRDVLASGEFRAIYAASALSWAGDYLARAAITAFVYHATGSVAASAAAFAISYAPWLLGGSVLVSLAERYSYRTVMVWCDVARMVIMAAVTLPELPTGAVLVLLFGSAVFSLPFDAARSATLPAILGGDRYVVGLAIHTTTAQPVQVAGYVAGASLAAVNPKLALLINAATFGASALLVRFGVQLRAPALDQARRTDLFHETRDGFRLVFRTPALRALVLLVFCGSLFAVVPEGLGAAWAAGFDDDQGGLTQGMIMAAVPFGMILGALLVTRLVPPAARLRLLRPLAVATPLALVPAFLDPPPQVVAVLAGACGFAIGAVMPIANGQFVQAVPNAYRARAFGVVSAGLQLLQGGAVLVTGALASRLPLPKVVGVWSLAGVGLMLLIAIAWPTPRVFADARAAAATANTETAPHPEEPAPAPAQRHDAYRRRLAAVMGTARRRSTQGRPGAIEQ